MRYNLILFYKLTVSKSALQTFNSLILRCAIHVVCRKTNGELISVRKHNYNCMLDDGIY